MSASSSTSLARLEITSQNIGVDLHLDQVDKLLFSLTWSFKGNSKQFRIISHAFLSQREKAGLTNKVQKRNIIAFSVRVDHNAQSRFRLFRTKRSFMPGPSYPCCSSYMTDNEIDFFRVDLECKPVDSGRIGHELGQKSDRVAALHCDHL